MGPIGLLNCVQIEANTIVSNGNFQVIDIKVDVDINAKDTSWYASPWVWVVGAAVFILLLVALTRGGSRSDA